MEERKKTGTAIFAGGCFWGIENQMRRAPGVISTEAGYTGGHTDNPTYGQVRTGTTGHAEAVRVVFDPSATSYGELAKLFFEIHDPTQVGRQGPDIGPQYRSEIFYLSPDQRETAEKTIAALKKRGYRVVTRVTPASTFHRAEEYHQNYSARTGTTPCNTYTKRF